MSGMFGAPNGFRTYDRDQAELAQLGAQTANVRADTAGREGLTRLQALQAGEIQRKAQMEQAELDFVRQALASSGGEADPLAQAERVGSAQIASGNLTKGLKTLEELAEVRQKMSGAEANLALADRRRVQADAQRLDFTRQVLSGVRDQASYNAAILALQGNPLTADEPIPAALRTYDQNTVNALIAGTEAKAREVKTRLDAADTASSIARRAAQNANDALRTKAVQSRAAAYVERSKRVEKVGGERSIPAPTAAERLDVSAALKRQGFEFGSDDKGFVIAELASEAKMLHRRVPGYTFQTALGKVILDAQSRGDLAAAEKTFGVTRKPAKFSAGLGSASRPAPLPSSREALKVGGYYKGADGSVRRFNGTAFEAALPSGQRPEFADDVDEEDEE